MKTELNVQLSMPQVARFGTVQQHCGAAEGAVRSPGSSSPWEERELLWREPDISEADVSHLSPAVFTLYLHIA